jgi:hypothetical protein
MLIALTALLVILVVALSVSLYYNYKFGRILIEVEDTVEDSLDLLDKNYEKLSKILEIPVFFDSVEVRQVIAEIDDARGTILKIANALTKSVGSEDGTQEKDS